ncbi:MAG TPA: RraA family protein [Conexibacter sp.]|nr:RraA family protein [Conexibacter sp.]
MNDQVSPDGLALVPRLAALYPAVVADCLDAVGVRSNVMAPQVRPLAPGMQMAGVARTLHAVAVDAPPASSGDYYAKELAAVDAVEEGSVLVISTIDGSIWGELLATAARRRGGRGVVVDGYTRDTPALIAMGFPTFAAGISCYDSLGRVEIDAVQVPVECGGVLVHPGDLVIGDHDGVVVVPAACAAEVVRLAEQKAADEGRVRKVLADGMSVSDAYAQYRVM